MELIFYAFVCDFEVLATRSQHFPFRYFISASWLYFFRSPQLGFISTRTDLDSPSRQNPGDIFYIIIAAPSHSVSLFMFCSSSRDFMTLAGFTYPHAIPYPHPKALNLRRKLLKQISLTLLTFPSPEAFFLQTLPSNPLNEIHFSICYSCLLYVWGIRFTWIWDAPSNECDTFSIIICTASKAQTQALWVMRLADAQKT